MAIAEQCILDLGWALGSRVKTHAPSTIDEMSTDAYPGIEELNGSEAVSPRGAEKELMRRSGVD